MVKFRSREIEYLDFSKEFDLDVLRIDRVVVKFYYSQSIDLGALCYLRREAKKRGAGGGRGVDFESYSRSRASSIRRLVEIVKDSSASGSIRPYTLIARFRAFSRFIDWCDENSHEDVLQGVGSARAAYRAWSADIRRRVDQHLLGNNTGAMEQRQVAIVLEEFYEIDDFAHGINVLSQTKDLVQPTVLPDDHARSSVLAWCECLFRGFSDLVLNRTLGGELEQFPYALEVPRCENYPNGCLWVFPLSDWSFDAPLGYVYDRDVGRIRSLSEVRGFYSKSRDAAIAVARAEKIIAAANADPYHLGRLWRGITACYAFHLLFMAVTGMNAASAADVPWSEEAAMAVENPIIVRQGIRVVKYRAGGKLQKFEIGVMYMPIFRKYLRLREFLLMGQKWEYLFFNYDPRRSSVIRRFRPAGVHHFYETLRKLCPDVPKISPRQWRASKQDYMVRQGDPILAAIVMQHSVATSIENYSNGTETDHFMEMGAYLGLAENSKNVILTRGAAVAERSTGACATPDEPKPIIDSPPVEPDCKRGEGCLFCEKYRIHADEADARKLLSARHCIRVSARYAGSVEEQNSAFGPVLRALEFYLDLIRSRDAALVERLEREVDIDGELSPFWAAKLDTLIELGMELQ
ncbi:hypothetical protein [Burkholderia cepacia]|uniref:hypothetical protein n=1 Tax=Burkholderia cepacia TaxID=292 RepID=UPI001CF4F9DE|nr:hypothetical protein [Burkholderia cepacia]MCA7893471.1 hypothetical protein [Burkholderia cepacia]